ncbi:hypothetical protein QQP08_015097 [Theobroma cacao]|uniref:Uncharacterized protein n=1 Tax=Theobroma cacao TaxID=3641 RepID=A0A061EE64_THECC|nr:Uncharacterized protein TCM_017078 [Theobroma cacao]WRX22610.1 hypothetical protein QQP08_015097 [Theobroma cacao]
MRRSNTGLKERPGWCLLCGTWGNNGRCSSYPTTAARKSLNPCKRGDATLASRKNSLDGVCSAVAGQQW